MNNLIKELEKVILETEGNKSSHWKLSLNKKNYFDIKLPMGFGTYTQQKKINSFFHNFFAKLIFDKKIFISDEYFIYKKIFDKISRQIDIDTIRHINTFDLLKKILKPKKICVIGDGKANFVLGSLKVFPSSKIYSVNLTETLINDYLIIEETKIIKNEEIQVINKKDMEEEKNKKLYLIPSSCKDFLKDKNIDLFINISSFQEMVINEVNNYFDIIKNNKALLYCCNREYKKLVGGEELYFEKYPWGDGKKMFYEDCIWHQKFYSIKPPFIHNYDGNHKHCLIDYKNI